MTRTAPAPPLTLRQRATSDNSDVQVTNGKRRWRSPRLVDAAICFGFLAFAVFLTKGLWPYPGSRALGLNATDQTLYEWFLAYDTRIWHGDFSLLSDRLNAPVGVNLLANTTVIALGTLFAPLTLLAGPGTTFAVLVVLNLAGTAAAWYLLFRQTFGARRLAAAIGGGFCGFAPGMISQSNAHLHITAQWLVPAMIWAVVRLWRAAQADDRRRRTTSALALAGLVTVQVFIGEETLFLTALSLIIFVATYAAVTRPPRRVIGRFAVGMALATGAASVLLAYPLWMQFRGPQHVPNGPFSPNYFSADLASFWAFSPLSIAGSEDSYQLSTGGTELNTFLGWPLLALIAICALVLIRNPVATSATVAGLVMCALSLGPDIVINRERTSHRGLFALIEGAPVIDGALPMRFALAAIPLIAVILVLTLDRVLRIPDGPIRWACVAVVGLALIPILPAPLPTVERPAIPRFYTEGHWRSCVPEGGVLVPVPLATPIAPEPMRYAAVNMAAFGMPEGFFIGPYGIRQRASIGTFKRPTSELLYQVSKTGKLPPITPNERATATYDISRWHADCIVLTETPHRAELQQALEQLLGRPGTPIADALTWKITRP